MKNLIISVFVSTLAIVGAFASKYEEARELYKEGPKKAPEIIKLLKDHLKAHPKDEMVVRLLGITHLGIGEADEALKRFDKAIDLAKQRDSIPAGVLMSKARALFELNRKHECKRILEGYWAFWQSNEKHMELYDWYWPRVKDAKEPKG